MFQGEKKNTVLIKTIKMSRKVFCHYASVKKELEFNVLWKEIKRSRRICFLYVNTFFNKDTLRLNKCLRVNNLKQIKPSPNKENHLATLLVVYRLTKTYASWFTRFSKVTCLISIGNHTVSSSIWN